MLAALFLYSTHLRAQEDRDEIFFVSQALPKNGLLTVSSIKLSALSTVCSHIHLRLIKLFFLIILYRLKPLAYCFLKKRKYPFIGSVQVRLIKVFKDSYQAAF